MITSITLKNFKSYESAEFRLEPLTFLIGANASGKSNAIEAIRLLVELAKGKRLDDIEREIQGDDAFIRGKELDLFLDCKNPFKIECEFHPMNDDWNCLTIGIGMTKDRLVIQEECVCKPPIMDEPVPLYEIASEPPELTDEVSVAYNNFQKGPNKPRIPCSNRQAIFYQLGSPSQFGEKYEKAQEIIPKVTNRIREELRNIVFLDPKPSAMRAYSSSKDNKMKQDGSNLSSVLRKVIESGETTKARLLDFVRSLPEQDITNVRFITTEINDVMVKLVESFGNAEKEVPAPLLSDGTLRVLAIAATLLSAREGSLVIIEEIDNGVHPSRARMLVEQIQQVSEERKLRVLVTTHNPALLDALPDNALADVLCCYRDSDDGHSKIARLHDLERYPELMARGSLGELVTNRTLDRFLKDKTTPDERKANYQRFLEQYEQEVSE